MLHKGIFISATDTNAGKTYITSLLLQALHERGITAYGYKPVAAGDREDAKALQQGLAAGLSLDEINPIYLQNATAPYVATLLEGRAVDLDVVEAGYRNLAARCDLVLVEGVGGVAVPLTASQDVSSLVKQLDIPVILVVENKLGAINHCLLSVSYLRAKGIKILGLILNSRQDEWNTACITNKAVIEQLSGLPILAEVIAEQDFIDIDELLAQLV